LVFPLWERADLQYSLHCAFTDPITNISPEVIAANFTYYISNDNFSVYQEPGWLMNFKIFNFNVLSDNSAVMQILLTKGQIEGNEPIWFNQTLGDIPDKFWSGNRLYAEIRWEFARGPVLSERMIIRQFLDSPDYVSPLKIASKSNKTRNIILGVVIPILVLAGIGAGYFLYRKKKSQLQIQRVIAHFLRDLNVLVLYLFD